jgi:hypothetical protein
MFEEILHGLSRAETIETAYLTLQVLEFKRVSQDLTLDAIMQREGDVSPRVSNAVMALLQEISRTESRFPETLDDKTVQRYAVAFSDAINKLSAEPTKDVRTKAEQWLSNRIPEPSAIGTMAELQPPSWTPASVKTGESVETPSSSPNYKETMSRLRQVAIDELSLSDLEQLHKLALQATEPVATLDDEDALFLGRLTHRLGQLQAKDMHEQLLYSSEDE